MSSSNSIDLAIDAIVADMYKFTDKHPNWDKKVWDVVQPVDAWGRNYAKLEYAHTGVKQTFSKRIKIK